MRDGLACKESELKQAQADVAQKESITKQLLEVQHLWVVSQAQLSEYQMLAAQLQREKTEQSDDLVSKQGTLKALRDDVRRYQQRNRCGLQKYDDKLACKPAYLLEEAKRLYCYCGNVDIMCVLLYIQ